MGRVQDALRDATKALALWKGLAERPGAPTTTFTELADAHENMAEAYIALDWNAKAAAEYEAGAQFYASLKERGALPKRQVYIIVKLKSFADLCRKSICAPVVDN